MLEILGSESFCQLFWFANYLYIHVDPGSKLTHLLIHVQVKNLIVGFGFKHGN
jgi:hypothetical protein